MKTNNLITRALIKALAALFTLLAVPWAHGQVTVANSGFDTPTVGSYQIRPSGGSWTFLNNAGISNGTWGGSGFGVVGGSNGQFAYIQTTPGSYGSISQNITFPVAGTYTLQYMVAGRWAASQGPGNCAYTVAISSSILSATGSTTTDQPFTAKSHSFTVGAAGTYTLTFTNTSSLNDDTFYVDTVSVFRQSSFVGGGGNLATGRRQHTATLLPNGKVLVAGGQDENGVYFASAELYDPENGSWTTTGSLASVRATHTATLLPNGKVLVAGGSNTSAEIYDPASGTWTTTGSLATTRRFHTATLLPNGKVLVAGGDASGYLASAELYDPEVGAWTTTGSLALSRQFHTATLLANGRVLVAGGFGSTGSVKIAELYDPVSETWTATGSLNTERINHTATLLPNGMVLVAGGAVHLAELYNPASGTWAYTGSLATMHSSHTATLQPNGKVLVTGGGNSTPITSIAELYDPATGTWSAAGNLNTARVFHTATLLANGKTLIVAGQNGNVRTEVEVYDPAVGTWSATGSLSTARTNPTMTLLANGKVLVAGNGLLGDSVELHDPANGTWTVTGSLAQRAQHTATLLPDGKVLVAGGFSQSGGTRAGADLYDPATGTWAATGSLTTARYQHTATLLPNGKVLVAGGFGGGYLNSAELYDPATGTWAATGNLNGARSFAVAALLPNGKVLVAAGTNGSPIASAELYDPATGAWTMTGSLATPRYRTAMTLLPNGKVLVTAGYNNFGITASVELYNPASGTWSTTGSLATARRDPTATLLPNGKVLVAGGVSDIASLSSTELYDPASGTWRASGSLITARNECTATLLANGKVLIAGGANAGIGLNSAELYDVGLNVIGSSRPQITAASFNGTGQLVVTGTGFNGISGGSGGGNTSDSPTNYPVVQLRWLDNGQSVILSRDAAANATAFTSTAGVNTSRYGYALVTVFANGIPSTAAMVLSPLPAPDIAVEEQPAGTSLTDNASTVSYGSVLAGTTSDRVFTIKNPGTLSLTGLGITIDGTHASEFSVTANPAPPVAPAGSTTFTVRFAPLIAGGAGTRTAALHIASNVSGTKNPFSINLSGSATADTTPPETQITSTQPTPTNSTSATITFTGTDNVAVTGFEGRLDGAPFATVTSPVTLTGLSDGSHTYEVRARDGSNNVDPTPASVTWVVDTAAPTFTLPEPITVEATGPSGAVVTYAASASDAGSGVASSSFIPASGSTFAPGTTTVNASATDNAGNMAEGSFTVTVQDTTAPVVAAPEEGFTLLALTADAGTGTANLPDYRSQVVASDNVGVASLTQTPAPGFVLGQGAVQVSITAEDAAGNVSDALVLTVVVGPAAAPVAGWSFTAWTGDSSTGIHASSNVWAHRFGSAATATVNGVTVPGSPFSLTSADVDVTLTSSYQGATNNLTTLGGTGSALMAQDFVYDGVQGPLTATVKNLTVGQKYAVSFFGVGFDTGVARSVNFTSGADSQVVNQNHYGLGNGIRVDYHFTATAATRAFTLMETAPLYSWGLNAITLRKVSIPDLVTDAATDVTTESATLNATVNPDGLAATAHFEYGLTTAYGSTAAITLSPADGSSAQAVSAPVSGLTAGRTYHYRVALTNLHGTFYGDDQTFSTVQIPSLFALSARTISVPQGSASVMIPLHRTGGSHAAGVQLSTVDGTASAVPPFAAGLAGKDYTALDTTVDFAEGEMQKEVEVTLIPRAGTNVPNTRFQVVLTGAGWEDEPADPKLGHPITATVQVLANDTTAPTLTVKTPANGATLNHAPPVIITGTVGDKYGIDRVEIEHGGELIVADLGKASRSTSMPFTAEIFPAADGPVTFTVTAYDLNGNSTVVTRAFNHIRWYDVVVSRSVPGGLATPEAAGMVTLASTKGSFSTLKPARGEPTQQGSVLPGAPVTLTARPAAGHVFSHWEGLPVDAVMSGTVASFTMPAEDVTEILAVFVANPFAALGTTAVFHGLLAPPEAQRGNATLGSLSATLTTKTGALSGKLLLGGVTTSFAGTVQGNGDVWLKNTGGPMAGSLEIPGIGTLVLFFASDSLDISLLGADTDSFGTARAAIHSAANPVPAALLNDAKQGFYTVALPALEQTPSRPASTYPQGAGYGSLTLKKNGTLTLAGVLADGSKFTAASALVAGNTSPVHAQLPTPGSTTLKGGSLLGVLAFDPDAPDSDVSSASLGWAVFGSKGGPPPEIGSGLLWLRPEVVQQTGTTAAALATQLYTEGWEQGITVGLVGALYHKAVTVQSALGLPATGPDGNAQLLFEDGKLDATVGITEFNVDGSKAIKLLASDKRFTLTLTANTGLMKGTFTPYWSSPGPALPAFNGVILQKGANQGGWGFFLSNRANDLDPESGGVTLGNP